MTRVSIGRRPHGQVWPAASIVCGKPGTIEHKMAWDAAPYTMTYLSKAFPDAAARAHVAHWLAVAYRSIRLHRVPQGKHRVGTLFLRSSAEDRQELESFTRSYLNALLLFRRGLDFSGVGTYIHPYEAVDESHPFAAQAREGHRSFATDAGVRWRIYLIVLGADTIENRSFIKFHDPGMKSAKERRAMNGELSLLARFLFDYFEKRIEIPLTLAERKMFEQAIKKEDDYGDGYEEHMG